MPPRKKGDVPPRRVKGANKPVVDLSSDESASDAVPSSPSSSSSSASSDDLDSSDLDADTPKKRKKPAPKGKGKTKASASKRSKADSDYAATDDDGDDAADDAAADSDDDDSGDERGRRVVGIVGKAPTTGLVPPGRISRNTLVFMTDLAVPANNDKDWFWRNSARYRVAQKEWYAFIDTLVPRLIEVDDEVPFVKANDVAHRINRDVRFSSDKTPYKRNLSMSISRSGRKGIFAHYHLSIMPGDRSMVAFGLWDPQKDELANIRTSFSHHPKRFRRIINKPEFVAEFGEGSPLPPPAKKPPKKRKKKVSSDSDSETEVKPSPKVVDVSRRRSVFGRQDELKVAPKGYSKDDPNIDLLRLRSVAVTKAYSDAEVVDPNFLDEVLRVAAIARPLVHYLNDIVTLPEEESEGQDE